MQPNSGHRSARNYKQFILYLEKKLLPGHPIDWEKTASKRLSSLKRLMQEEFLRPTPPHNSLNAVYTFCVYLFSTLGWDWKIRGSNEKHDENLKLSWNHCFKLLIQSHFSFQRRLLTVLLLWTLHLNKPHFTSWSWNRKDWPSLPRLETSIFLLYVHLNSSQGP